MSHTNTKLSKKAFLLTALGALGVVYGDIGTSPLYALNEIVHHVGEQAIASNPIYILGPISLIIWALTLVVTIKYVSIILNADNGGEGGVFALYSKMLNYKGRSAVVLAGLLVLSAGLLFGDGIITPAISVLSAVEGLKVAVPALESLVIPITVAILTGLFFIQKNGTAKVGIVFGPIIGVWFLSLAGIGLYHLLQAPEILKVFNPHYAYLFIKTAGLHTSFIAIGLVMLAVTGGEALYADMGHFGKNPIKLSWFALVYPALILNYLGQGAFLISGHQIIAGNLFFSTVPHIVEIPMLILATCATIIASQALISGAFSIAFAAINLNLIPRMFIKYTHEEHMGQIYIPFINWGLYLGCIMLVFAFKTSSNLASAYGLAVAACMLIDSLCMFLVTKYEWKWSLAKTCLVFVPLLIMDVAFFSANSLKFFKGGYVPATVGFTIFIVMTTWQWGRRTVSKQYSDIPQNTINDIVNLKNKNGEVIDRTYVFMSRQFISALDQKVPTLMQTYMDRFARMPKHIIFLTVNQTSEPYVTDERYKVAALQKDGDTGSIASVQVNFGFMEDQNAEGILEGLAEHNQIDIDHDPSRWLVRILQERIIPAENISFARRLRYGLFDFLNRNSLNFDEYFGLGQKQGLTSEIVPVILE